MSHWIQDVIDSATAELVKAAVDEATPHLRRKHRQELLDELIAEAEDEERQGIDGVFETFAVDCLGCTSGWLRYKKEAE